MGYLIALAIAAGLIIAGNMAEGFFNALLLIGGGVLVAMGCLFAWIASKEGQAQDADKKKTNESFRRDVSDPIVFRDFNRLPLKKREEILEDGFEAYLENGVRKRAKEAERKQKAGEVLGKAHTSALETMRRREKDDPNPHTFESDAWPSAAEMWDRADQDEYA